MLRPIALGQRAIAVDRTLVAIIATVTLWSLNVSNVKWALGQWNPLAYSVVRFIFGTAIFAGWVYMREGSLRVERRDLPLLAVAGAVGIFLNQIGFMYAVTYATATTVSLILATTPVFAAIAAAAIGQERVGRRHWVGMAVAGVGTLLVLRGGGATLEFASLRGDLFALLMASTFGIYSVLIRPLMRRYSAARISVIVLMIGTPMLVPFAWNQLATQDYGAITLGGWGALLFSLFFSLVFTNILWFGAIHRDGAARTVAFTPLQPFLGAMFAFALLGESLAPLQMLGGAVIIGGIVLSRRRVPLEESATPD